MPPCVSLSGRTGKRGDSEEQAPVGLCRHVDIAGEAVVRACTLERKAHSRPQGCYLSVHAENGLQEKKEGACACAVDLGNVWHGLQYLQMV